MLGQYGISSFDYPYAVFGFAHPTGTDSPFATRIVRSADFHASYSFPFSEACVGLSSSSDCSFSNRLASVFFSRRA